MSLHNLISALLLAIMSTAPTGALAPFMHPLKMGQPRHVTASPAPQKRPRGNQRSESALYNGADTSNGNNNNEEDDPVLRLPLMEAELALETSQDSNEELQAAIDNAKMAAEFGVRKAQIEFYDAFSAGDFEAMSRVWCTKHEVRCIHPGMPAIQGRQAVLQSWSQIFDSARNNNNEDDDSATMFQIQPSRVSIEICGLVALCSCVEETKGGGRLECLNVYKREDHNWRMSLHMAGPIVVVGTDAMF